MSRELLCYLQKNAFTVLISTDHLPFSLVPRTSSRRELNQNPIHVTDRGFARHELNLRHVFSRNFKEIVNV